MAYSSQSLTVASASHLVDALKDFMVSCGWTLVGPSSSSELSKQGDPKGLMLGWFLNSKGEDGRQDIHAHLGFNADANGQTFTPATYLTSDVSDSATTIPVKYSGIAVAGQLIRLDDELILIGSVSGNNYLNCVRGWGSTTAAAHTAGTGNVVQKVTLLYPTVEVFATRDLSSTGYIARDTSGPYSITSSTQYSTVTVAGLSGYGTDGLGSFGQTNQGRFSCQTCLLKTIHNTDATKNGIYRWISTYTTASGAFDMQPFVSDFSVDGVEVYAAGFLPAFSRRRYFVGTYMNHHGGLIRAYTTNTAGNVWFYGSKNAIIVVTSNSGNYDAFYFGNVATISNPFNALTTTSLAASGTTVTVDTASYFTAGQKIRLISQKGADWRTNKDVIVGSFPKIDAEEIPTEELVIQSVDYDTKILTFTTGAYYTYSTGAIIGEDPRPVIRQSSCEFNSTYGDWFNTNGNFWPCYLPCNKSVLTSHASHRQTFRAWHAASVAYNPAGTAAQQSRDFRMPKVTTPIYTNIQSVNKNYQNNELVLTPMHIGQTREAAETTFNTYGVFLTLKGVLHSVFECQQSPPFSTASSLDTVQVLWNGQYRTFRFFLVGRVNTVYAALGPEPL